MHIYIEIRNKNTKHELYNVFGIFDDHYVYLDCFENDIKLTKLEMVSLIMSKYSLFEINYTFTKDDNIRLCEFQELEILSDTLFEGFNAA